MAACNMTTEETFKFIELYQTENCLWNPKNKYHKNKNVVNDAWKRIADATGVPIHELKKKKDNVLATFRLNLKKKLSSIKSGAGVEDVFKPIWIFYDAMEIFLKNVYESTSIMNTIEKDKQTQPDLVEESSNSSSSGQAGNVRSEAQNEEGVPSNSSQQNPIVPTPKRRAINPPELQEAGRQMNTALTTFNKFNNTVNKENPKEEDECDLFCKMLAKQIKGYPKLEREEIMYEIHGVMMNKRRRYERERVMQGKTYSVSSPAQVILSRPTSSNTVYLSQSPSPSYVINSPDSMPQNNQQSERINTISEEIIQPETSRGCYESFENVISDDFLRANFIPDSHKFFYKFICNLLKR